MFRTLQHRIDRLEHRVTHDEDISAEEGRPPFPREVEDTDSEG